MTVENMLSASGRASEKRVPNQIIIENEGIKTFQSYDSKIAEYNTNTGELTVYSKWDCSSTTLKYFKQFVNDYTGYNYQSKEQFEKMAKQTTIINFVK